MTPELHRPFALDRVGPTGTGLRLQAQPEELGAIARRLRIPGVGSLECTFKLRRIGSSTIEAVGALAAEVTQVCVVSLDEFTSVSREEFTVHFVPSGTEDDDPDPDAIDQIPYEGSAVDLGEAAVEQLALALDPYPRKPGAALPDGAGPGSDGVFAALAGLKRTQ